MHLIVRGVDDRGADLVIARDYISSGLPSRAGDLVVLELGPKPEHEIRHALEHEVTAERWTRLDRELRHQTDDLGLIDLRSKKRGLEYPQIRRLMIGRLQHLRKLGLAAEARTGEWLLDARAERPLRALGERGDIIKTMHRALAARRRDRGFSDLAIDRGGPGDPIIGRAVALGMHNEQTGTAYGRRRQNRDGARGGQRAREGLVTAERLGARKNGQFRRGVGQSEGPRGAGADPRQLEQRLLGRIGGVDEAGDAVRGTGEGRCG